MAVSKGCREKRLLSADSDSAALILPCSAGAQAPAVVNTEDIEIGDGMEDDEDDADALTGDVQLQQKAVPVGHSACIRPLTHVQQSSCATHCLCCYDSHEIDRAGKERIKFSSLHLCAQ